jgi:hypothetical protein
VAALVEFSASFKISPFEFLLQMAAPSNIFWDHAGHLHTNALHWEGFPHLLWESLRLFFYTEPPQYDGVEYREEGVPQCRVKMTIPQHPFCSRSMWLVIVSSTPLRPQLLRPSILSATSIPQKLPGILWPIPCNRFQ